MIWIRTDTKNVKRSDFFVKKKCHTAPEIKVVFIDNKYHSFLERFPSYFWTITEKVKKLSFFVKKNWLIAPENKVVFIANKYHFSGKKKPYPLTPQFMYKIIFKSFLITMNWNEPEVERIKPFWKTFKAKTK